MSAKYYLFQNPPQEGSKEEKPGYHVRITQKGTIPFKQVYKLVAASSTISIADSRGAITGLIDILISYLKEGYTVEIEGLGYFKVAAKAPIVQDPKQIRAQHIQYAGVKFRPAKDFTIRMSQMSFVRDPAHRQGTPLTQEQRVKNIVSYLDTKNPFIVPTA